jgi:hypothetical protein
MRDTRLPTPETAPQNEFRWLRDAPRPLETQPRLAPRRRGELLAAATAGAADGSES